MKPKKKEDGRCWYQVNAKCPDCGSLLVVHLGVKDLDKFDIAVSVRKKVKT